MPRALPYDLVSCSISIASIVIARAVATPRRRRAQERSRPGIACARRDADSRNRAADRRIRRGHGSDDEHRGASVEVEQAQGRSTVEHLDGDVQSRTPRPAPPRPPPRRSPGPPARSPHSRGAAGTEPTAAAEIPTRHHVQADVLPTGRIGAPPQRGCRRLGAVDPHDHAPVCVRLRAHRPAAFAPRCSANQLLARVATVSSAPGSSKRCVAPGTTTTSCSQRIIAAAS